MVLDQLGLPGAAIGSEYWIYWDFSLSQPTVNAAADTLVIRFVDGKVASMRLCEARSIRALLAARTATTARAPTQARSNGGPATKPTTASLAEARRSPSPTQSALVDTPAGR